MSSGAKVQLAWIKEATPGVTPSGNWNTLTRISNGVTPTYNTEENNEIGADRMAQGTAQTTVDVGGDIETKWRYGALDEFMEAYLRWQRAEARYWDPYFPELKVGSETLRSSKLDDAALDWADAVVLLVPHNGPNYEWLARRSRLVLDTVNHLASLNAPSVMPL